MNAITYYLPNGEIDSVLTGDASVIEATIEVAELPWIESAWDRLTHYVLDGEAVDRPANPATLHGYTLENLPVPCTIMIKGQSFECTDTVCTLSFNFQGTYAVKVVSWPHLDKEFTVEYSV